MTDRAWRFVVPRYAGARTTKIRFRLDPDRKGGTPIYSNEFEGGVNPEQFSAKQGHTPSGLMDPYND